MKPEKDKNEIVCDGCAGEGGNCEVCDGKGKLDLNGNIDSFITHHGLDVWESYKWLKTYNQFPVDGGYWAQSAKFIHCVKWVDLINLKFEKLIKKQTEDATKMSGKFRKLLGGSKTGAKK